MFNAGMDGCPSVRIAALAASPPDVYGPTDGKAKSLGMPIAAGCASDSSGLTASAGSCGSGWGHAADAVIHEGQMFITAQSGVCCRVKLSCLAWCKPRIARQMRLNRVATGSGDVGDGNALLV